MLQREAVSFSSPQRQGNTLKDIQQTFHAVCLSWRDGKPKIEPMDVKIGERVRNDLFIKD